MAGHDSVGGADGASAGPDQRETRNAHGDRAGAGGHVDHSGHEAMFRRRFWVSLVLSVPVVVFSEFVQDVVGYTAPVFPGSELVTPVLSVVVFAPVGVLLSPAIGAVFMSLSTIIVAVNARRLRSVDLSAGISGPGA